MGPGVRLVCATGEASKQLSVAIESFARHHITVENQTIRIPALLNWYLDTVLLSQEPEGSAHPQGSSSRLMRRLQVLIDFLMENSCSEEWLASLKDYSFTGNLYWMSFTGNFPEYACLYSNKRYYFLF